MGKFLAAAEAEGERVREVLLFALLCILESISYTRKDGQYLRWDYRSGRRQGKKIFDKGELLPFDSAITDKLREIVSDLQAATLPEDLFFKTRSRADVLLHSGSCLELLPRFQAGAYDVIITSPPYCNRYDYTRTYALELALLGVDEAGRHSVLIVGINAQAGRFSMARWTAPPRKEGVTYQQHVEQYALDPNLLDSDFFEGRGNLEGIFAAAAYGLSDNVIGTVRYGYATRINDKLGTGGSNQDIPQMNPIHRYNLLQLDLTFRF